MGGGGALSAWLVVSPHLDDAILSMGATIAHHARRGGRVTIVTVLAGDVTSTVPAGTWDRRGGHADEGGAARARRLEDERACAVVGASAVRLPGRDDQYQRGERDAELWRAVGELATSHDRVFLPGAPLVHDDHEEVEDRVRGALPAGSRVSWYAEEPYLLWSKRPPSPPRTATGWRRRRLPARDVVAKARALRCYRTQLPLLASEGVASRGEVAGLLLRLTARAAAGEWLDEDERD